MPRKPLSYMARSCAMFACVGLTCFGQTARARKESSSGPTKLAHLRIVDTVVSKSEMAEGFVQPFQCDVSGNIYLMGGVAATSGIRKVNLKGERVATFTASSASDLQVQLAAFFSVTPDGEVYQLAYLQRSLVRVVLVYDRDGTYKKHIKLRTGFDWTPSQVVAFASGDLLVAGLADDPDPHVRVKEPFTAILSADGSMVKQIALTDDKEIHDMAVAGDSHVVPPDSPTTSMAVMGGQMEAAEDGNVYLMRRLSPAIFYAISPGGEVVKRFTVDGPDTGFSPVGMHIAGRRIGVLFWDQQARQKLIKILDLDGHLIATYDDPVVNGREPLSPAFGCYMLDQHERFLFLHTGDKGFLAFQIAEPE